MAHNKNEHILTASSNLLGFSFIAVTMMRALNLIHQNRVEQFAALGVGVFAFSVILSFLSIRSADTTRGKLYENIAEYLFLGGLIMVVTLIVLIEARLV